MTYQLPEPALPNCVIGQDSTMRTVRLDCYTADQMQAAWQTGRDSDTALLRQALEALAEAASAWEVAWAARAARAAAAANAAKKELENDQAN